MKEWGEVDEHRGVESEEINEDANVRKQKAIKFQNLHGGCDLAHVVT